MDIGNPKNVLQIFMQRAKKNPTLRAAYNEEKKKYITYLKVLKIANDIF